MAGEAAPELEPEVSDLLREFCRLKPVPIWLATGKGAGVGSLGSLASGGSRGLMVVKFCKTEAKSRVAAWSVELDLDMVFRPESSQTAAGLTSTSKASSSSSSTIVHFLLAAATSEGVKRPSIMGEDKGGKLILLVGRCLL